MNKFGLIHFAISASDLKGNCWQRVWWREVTETHLVAAKVAAQKTNSCFVQLKIKGFLSFLQVYLFAFSIWYFPLQKRSFDTNWRISLERYNNRSVTPRQWAIDSPETFPLMSVILLFLLIKSVFLSFLWSAKLFVIFFHYWMLYPHTDTTPPTIHPSHTPTIHMQ